MDGSYATALNIGPVIQGLVTDQRSVAAVIVTHDRPALLTRCLAALSSQTRQPDAVFVIDNASREPASAVVARTPNAQTIRLERNLGAAAGFSAGIRAARAGGFTHVWMMDDDGEPAGPACLAGLLATEAACASDLTCPLVLDVADPARLAFPIRQTGRTRFTVAALARRRYIEGFAHLFNGALIARSAFDTIGLPNASLGMRGDEVDFLLRARRAGLRIVTDTHTAFLHPSSNAEIHPILGGLFYAVVPLDAAKRTCQFRNRGWIFTRYGLWLWLAADHIRYAIHFLGQRDPAAYAAWLHATWSGVLGRLEPAAAPLPLLPVCETAAP